jgi:hypothetical protein
MAPEPTGYSVSIADNVDPSWTPDQAAAKAMAALLGQQEALGQVLAEPRILSVAAMKGKDVPDSFDGPFPENDLVWVVDCQGSFVQQSGWHGAPWMGTHGFFIFGDDGDGVAAGADLTIPPASPSPTS